MLGGYSDTERDLPDSPDESFTPDADDKWSAQESDYDAPCDD
jgi:hypothetical protein